MRLVARTSGAVRAVVLAMTVVFVALVLVAGQGGEVDAVTLEQGQPAPETLIATRDVEVVDEATTEAARQAAGREVDEVYAPDAAAASAALRSIQDFFANVDEAALPLEFPGDEPGVVPTVTTTPTTVAETTTSTVTDTTVEETTTSEGSTTSEETTSTSTSTTTTLPPPPPEEVQIAQLREEHPLLRTETIQAMVAIRNDDFDRVEAEEAEVFPLVETEALTLANTYLAGGIRSGDLQQVRNSLVSDPPNLILLRDLPEEQRLAAEAGVADLVATSLQPNFFPDEAATQFAREQAMAEVENVTKAYVAGENIVNAGELVSAVQLLAINELDLLIPEESGPSLPAMALVATLVVLLAVFYLWRVGREYWQQPEDGGPVRPAARPGGRRRPPAGPAGARPRRTGVPDPGGAARLPGGQPVRFPHRSGPGAAGGGVHRPGHGERPPGDLRGGGHPGAHPAGVGGLVAHRTEPGGGAERGAARPAGGGARLVLLPGGEPGVGRPVRGGFRPDIRGGRPRGAAVPGVGVRDHHHPDIARPHRPQPPGAAPARGGGSRHLQPQPHGGQPGREGGTGRWEATRCSPRPWLTSTTWGRRSPRSTTSRTSSASPTPTTGSRRSTRRRCCAAMSPRACA